MFGGIEAEGWAVVQVDYENSGDNEFKIQYRLQVVGVRISYCCDKLKIDKRVREIKKGMKKSIGPAQKQARQKIKKDSQFVS